MRSTTKAVAGAIMAGATTAAALGSDGHLSGLDLVGILGAIAAGFLGVYVAPRNTHPPRDPGPRPGVRRRRP